ncbi:MAG: BrnA antitoxin family protein [Terriglobales bacterium]
MPEESIDLSDIPELTADQIRSAARNRYYRAVKRPVTMRLDLEIIDWLKRDGPGYQTKANEILRQAMIRDAIDNAQITSEKRKSPVSNGSAVARTPKSRRRA